MREEPDIYLAYDMVERHLVGGSFVAIESETAAGIRRESSIVAHHEESRSDDERIYAASSFGLDASGKIIFIERIALLYGILRLADLYAVIRYLDGLAGEPDDPLDVRDGLSRRDEDDDIASLELAESRSYLIDDDEIILFERRRHARSYDRIRIGDEKPDEEDYSSYEYQEGNHIKYVQEEIFQSCLESHNVQYQMYKTA